MFTGVTARVGSLVTVIAVLTGVAILRGATAAADSNQDDQFLALLAKEDIPALEGVPSLIAEAHKVCRALDAGFSADTVVRAMLNYAYSADPIERQFDPGRLARTEARFIAAAVGAYCPYDHSKLASIMANPTPGSNEPTYRAGAYTQNAANSGGTALVSLVGTIPGQVTPPDPPQIPVPPPPTAQTLAPPLPIAAPPPPKQAPRPPQQPQSPPQPVAPPAAGPQPAPLPPAAPPPAAPPPPAPPPPPQAPPPPLPPPVPPKPPPPPPPAPPKSPPGFVQLAP